LQLSAVSKLGLRGGHAHVGRRAVRPIKIAPPGVRSNATQTPQNTRETPVPWTDCTGTSSMTIRFAKAALVAAIAVWALAACSQRRELASRADLVAERVAAPAPPPPIFAFGTAQAAPANAQMKLAVTHTFELSMPSDQVEAVQRRHLDECAKLGCTVLTTSLQHGGQGSVYARTSLRISPQSFDALAKALAAAPARITSHAQTAEDKTIPLLDVEKRLEAKTALRDRLEAMLKDPATKSTADLLAIEKELALIQGDIESATAQRDYLRTITDTVRVDISYDGIVAEVGGVNLAPLKRAASEFGDTVLTSLATLIYVFAALLPWLPVILLLGWAIRRGVRRWRTRARSS
jgi:hypothetical protein